MLLQHTNIMNIQVKGELKAEENILVKFTPLSPHNIAHISHEIKQYRKRGTIFSIAHAANPARTASIELCKKFARRVIVYKNNNTKSVLYFHPLQLGTTRSSPLIGRLSLVTRFCLRAQFRSSFIR